MTRNHRIVCLSVSAGGPFTHTFRSFRQLELSATRSVRNAHPILSMAGPGDCKTIEMIIPAPKYSTSSVYVCCRQLMPPTTHLCYWQCWIGVIGTLGPFRWGDGGEGGSKAVLQFRVGDDVVHELFVLLQVTKGSSSSSSNISTGFNWTSSSDSPRGKVYSPSSSSTSSYDHIIPNTYNYIQQVKAGSVKQFSKGSWNIHHGDLITWPGNGGNIVDTRPRKSPKGICIK